MVELYAFGYGKAFRLPNCPEPQNIPTPTCVQRATQLKILWASWCDLILELPSTDPLQEHMTVEYYGTSLTPQQAQHISSLYYFPERPEDNQFFGRSSDHGVLGYVSPVNHSLTVFHTASDIRTGLPEVETFSFEHTRYDILDIRFTAGQKIVLSTEARAYTNVVDGSVTQLPGLSPLLNSLRKCDKEDVWQQMYDGELMSFAPSQWCTNASALTALDEEGNIYTYAADLRFPKTLGRPPSTAAGISADVRATALRVPYFSETKIKKVASGGSYSAAVTSDGELYIWGQASSDSKGHELAVLTREPDEGEDDYVRCVEFIFEGNIDTGCVIVTDVAVGNGHVLVAAEAKTENKVVRAVFAAGNNGMGQLGLGLQRSFVDEFTEVTGLRGKKVREMQCAGWLSYVVVEDEGVDEM